MKTKPISICILFFILSATNLFAGYWGVTLESPCNYQINGNQATITVNIDNGTEEHHDNLSKTNDLTVELWAKIQGENKGYMIADFRLAGIDVGESYNNVQKTVSMQMTPPKGYYDMQLILKNGTKYADDYEFAGTRYFPGSSNNNNSNNTSGSLSDLSLMGGWHWQEKKSNIKFGVGKIQNKSSHTSGELRLQLRARETSSSKYYLLGEYTLDGLPPNSHYSDVEKTVNYSRPPKGSYYVVLQLAEDSGKGFVEVDSNVSPERELLNQSEGSGSETGCFIGALH